MLKTMRPRVAVVDDEPIILEAWSEILRDEFDVKLFSDPLAAQRFFESEDIDVALLDIRMPGLDGLTLLERLHQVQPRAAAIVVTGHGTVEIAVEAMRSGAYDFLCKPIDDLDQAVRRVRQAAEHKRLRETNANLRELLEAYQHSELIGNSAKMHKVRELIGQVADASAPVLICGESGTGKELAARALHAESSRAAKPFVAVNCAAVTETLIDSELFGHERGAFTGALNAHKGLFEAADGGVLFLDEIGDVPPQTQVRLLRALQEGEIRAVGAHASRKVDVRVLAATNVDLERAMRAGRFREDLYYRISTFRLDLPPLRERSEDIPLIAQHLLDAFNRRAGNAVAAFSDGALAALVAYGWPGNVRELSNCIEHAGTLCRGDVLSVEHLPAYVLSGGPRRSDGGGAASVPYSDARRDVLHAFEQRYLTDLLESTAGNLSEAARRSGIDRANLRRLLQRHGIRVETFR